MTGERRCVGYRVRGSFRSCPDAAAPAGAQCPACAGRDDFRLCLTCDGFRCPPRGHAVERYCRQTHHLYLACFGDQTIKVGTASDPRRVARIVEQGPLAAARVARASGPIVKQMEHLLSRDGFAETMRRSYKVRLLRGVMGEPEARELVTLAAELIRGQLPAEHQAWLHPPVFVDQPELAVRSRGLPVDLLELAPGTLVDGEVVGAIGHVAFVDDGDGPLALDLGDLRARVIVLDPAEGGPRPVVQLGLFR